MRRSIVVSAASVAALAVLAGAAGTVWYVKRHTGSAAPAPPDPGLLRSATPRMPGEQLWRNGVSSYIFGTNDSIEYGNPNVQTIPSVQQEMKEGGLTLMRTWAYWDYSDQALLQRIATIDNSGMRCMMMLGTPTDAAWMEHVVSLLGSRCNIYELGNEPDNPPNHTNIATLVSEWDAVVPRLRALNRNAVFGGPAVMYPTSTDGSQAPYPSDIAYFLAKTAASGVRADFISYHDYPCGSYTSQPACIAHTPDAFSYDQAVTLAWEKQYYGRTIPTGISEYNFDPGSGTLYAWGGDSSFMYRWTEAALNTFIEDHFSFALQFTTLNWGGYGNLDMFSDASPYTPKSQFFALADLVRKEGGPSHLVTPSPPP